MPEFGVHLPFPILAADYGPDFLGAFTGACIGTLGAWGVMAFQKKIELKQSLDRDEINCDTALKKLRVVMLLRQERLKPLSKVIGNARKNSAAFLDLTVYDTRAPMPPIDLDWFIFVIDHGFESEFKRIVFADSSYWQCINAFRELNTIIDRHASDPIFQAEVQAERKKIGNGKPDPSSMNARIYTIYGITNSVYESLDNANDRLDKSIAAIEKIIGYGKTHRWINE